MSQMPYQLRYAAQQQDGSRAGKSDIRIAMFWNKKYCLIWGSKLIALGHLHFTNSHIIRVWFMSVNNPHAICVWPGFCLISIKVCFLFCTMISSVDPAHYLVSHAKDWVSVDWGTIANVVHAYTIYFIVEPACKKARHSCHNFC